VSSEELTTRSFLLGWRRRYALALVLTAHCSLLTGHCFAHPVPRSEYDRNLTVEWRADGVYLLYRLEIDEYTLLTTVGNPANGFPLDPKKLRVGRKDVADAYIARMREIIPDGVTGSVNGKPLTFTCTDARVDFLDSAQFRFKLKAPFALTPGRHTLEVEDLNFLDKKGKLVMKFEPGPGVTAEKVTEPPEGARLDATEAERRTVGATVVVPGTPSSPAPVTEPAPESEVITPAPPTEPAGVWELLRKVEEEENLAVLLDSRIGLWVVLLIAALHGVLHSVSPGHGKTMVAAYLIGEQGTPKHAIILGLIVTLTHTSAAFAVALLLRFVFQDTAPQTVQSVLGIGGGALVTFVGLWLFMQRLAGRSDHVHLVAHSHSHGDGHSHSHSHGTDGHAHSHGLTPEQFGRVGWVRLVLLGISGGVIPCWGAILWVLYCVTAGRFGLAVWAVLAFSVGLASVLILIGLSVVWGGRAGARRFGGRTWFRYVSRWLPVVGAALVMVIGLWLVRINLPK
jgi:nickel/cobalt transporter (NicO) family protein